MPTIRRLDAALVNKIAAGEVVERPASVVKELIENALDAGASRVDIALEGGGCDLIRVTDNGGGIGRDDLALAVAPHATSKIVGADDLFNIRTLGFRGEALASIGSISHLRIVSRPPEQIEAYEISGPLDSQSAVSLAVAAAPLGTTVEVRDLFFNVPARRKFLKQPATECAHVSEQVARLSLSHPNVAFTLTHHGRVLRNLPASHDRRIRIADFYGADLAECLLAINRDERGLRVEGLIAPPAQSRPSSKWQYLFLNGRYITDRRLAFAVREAFRGLVEHDRYPVVFLFLSADPHDFDVNVHPTKIEVRWRDAGMVQSQVLAVLRETLLSHDLTPSLGFHRRGSMTNYSAAGISTNPDAAPLTEQQKRARMALADYLKRVDPTQTRLTFAPPPFRTEFLRPSIAGTLRRPPLDDAADSLTRSQQPLTTIAPEPDRSVQGEVLPASHELGRPVESPCAETTEMTISEAPGASHTLGPLPSPGGVMQIHNTYLVAQTAEGVIIIDQHALHERILYERFRERILQGPLESQRLLIPEPVTASPTQMETARQFEEMLGKLGIELAPFGPGCLAVQAFPTLLGMVSAREFVSGLLDCLGESEGAASEETAIHAALDMMACKAAVKAGDALTTEEMLALLEMRHLTERSSNCPHGRPTTLELTTRDLEKQFKRT